MIGTTVTLKVMKMVSGGLYLDGLDTGEVFLPKREIPANTRIGDPVTVFVYRDSDTVLTATTASPKAQLGQCAFLKVVNVTKSGVFVDWGLPKDLFVPASEQYKPLEIGRSYVILVYLDERTGRLAGTAKLHSYLNEDGTDFKAGQQVPLLISGFSDLGYKAVINNTHLGLIFRDDAAGELRYGQSLLGYIKAIRDDKKIDLALLPPGLSGLDALGEQILEQLRDSGGRLRLTDKSTAEEIAALFKTSKSNFKKAVGRLYKQKLIRIEADHIALS